MVREHLLHSLGLNYIFFPMNVFSRYLSSQRKELRWKIVWAKNYLAKWSKEIVQPRKPRAGCPKREGSSRRSGECSFVMGWEYLCGGHTSHGVKSSISHTKSKLSMSTTAQRRRMEKRRGTKPKLLELSWWESQPYGGRQPYSKMLGKHA